MRTGYRDPEAGEGKNRAAVGSHYYTVMLEGEGSWMVQKVKERGDAFDDACHASGNYYISIRSARTRVALLRRTWEREYERTHGKRPRQFNRRNYKKK